MYNANRYVEGVVVFYAIIFPYFWPSAKNGINRYYSHDRGKDTITVPLMLKDCAQTQFGGWIVSFFPFPMSCCCLLWLLLAVCPWGFQLHHHYCIVYWHFHMKLWWTSPWRWSWSTFIFPLTAIVYFDLTAWSKLQCSCLQALYEWVCPSSCTSLLGVWFLALGGKFTVFQACLGIQGR